MSRDIKTLTTKNILTTSTEGWAGEELYQLSCLMRIADAAEKTAAASEAMAANYNRMKNDKELYERWYNEEKQRVAKLEARNASLRGVITRMKNEKKRAAMQEPTAPSKVE